MRAPCGRGKIRCRFLETDFIFLRGSDIHYIFPCKEGFKIALWGGLGRRVLSGMRPNATWDPNFNAELLLICYRIVDNAWPHGLERHRDGYHPKPLNPAARNPETANPQTQKPAMQKALTHKPKSPQPSNYKPSSPQPRNPSI